MPDKPEPAMTRPIDYHRAPNAVEKEAERRRAAARRDKAIRWILLFITLLVIAASIFLYTFPARLFDINGYTR
ncbi:MAG TPA: hypothetical protein VGI81_04840 [Tepidisphaeraceae bacterium]